MQAEQNDLDTVEVRRDWDSGDTAKYALDAVSRWHWDFVGGRMQARKAPCFLYGYVMCDEAISGGVSHSCSHGPPPHNIKICILEEGNEAIWSEIIRCAGPRPQPRSVAEEIRRVNRTKRFRDRGLSGMTIHKLIAAGIDAPERLLFMSPMELGKLEGIEPVMRREIDAYRSRFVRG
jgi:hypothetical protein